MYICVHLHFPFCPPGIKEKVLPPQLSSSWNWIPSPLTFSRFYSSNYLLFHLNYQSSPFLWDDSLQLTNVLGSPLFLKVLCWFPHPSLINSHSSTSLHNLLPQNSYLHNLHCFTSITLQIIKLCLFPYHFTKMSHVKVPNNFPVVKLSVCVLGLTQSLCCIRPR